MKQYILLIKGYSDGSGDAQVYPHVLSEQERFHVSNVLSLLQPDKKWELVEVSASSSAGQTDIAQRLTGTLREDPFAPFRDPNIRLTP